MWMRLRHEELGLNPPFLGIASIVFVILEVLVLFLLHLKLLLVQLLELFHTLEMVQLHLFHGLSVLIFLFGFLELEVLVCFVELVKLL